MRGSRPERIHPADIPRPPTFGGVRPYSEMGYDLRKLFVSVR